MSIKLNYHLALIIAQVLVGVSIVICKVVVACYSTYAILFWRFTIAALFLFVLHFFRVHFNLNQNQTSLRDLSSKDWLYMTMQGLCGGAFFNLFLLWGLNHTTAATAGIITSMLPAIIVIFSIVFLSERLTLVRSVCVFLALMGLVVINFNKIELNQSDKLWGDFLILLALIPEATYYILARVYVSPLPLFLTAAIMNVVNIPFSLLLVALTQTSLLGPASGLSLLLVLGLATGFFYVFWFYGCRHVKGYMAGLITAAMPLSTLVIAWLFLGEAISLFQITGMILVILSIIVSASSTKAD